MYRVASHCCSYKIICAYWFWKDIKIYIFVQWMRCFLTDKVPEENWLISEIVNLGKGTFGEVCRCHCKLNHTLFAVKKVFVKIQDEKEYEEKIKNEFDIAKEFKHPNIGIRFMWRQASVLYSILGHLKSLRRDLVLFYQLCYRLSGKYKLFTPDLIKRVWKSWNYSVKSTKYGY